MVSFVIVTRLRIFFAFFTRNVLLTFLFCRFRNLDDWKWLVSNGLVFFVFRNILLLMSPIFFFGKLGSEVMYGIYKKDI